MSRKSRDLYRVVNDIIGEPVIINIRRTTTNILDYILQGEGELMKSPVFQVYSGSRAEGMRFKSSDHDWMFIYKDIKVFPSDSYMPVYNSNTTLLLMENKMTKPGFTLLRLIDKSTKPEVIGSTENILDGRYLSCKRWRELHTADCIGYVFTHGPCSSGVFGVEEFDLAFCVQCDFWPTNAHDCIRRLHQCGWPLHDTILSIVSDGVLFVAIGAKQSLFENTEWRMSFSLAEKKLIHSMNHTQFLCYGLLKLFMKEVIDAYSEVKGLLCSYFLKTALFWEITTSVNHWNPSSLLTCFWKCFNRLLQWVNCSYCPNFFIPQNNMFAGKIEGPNRDKLLPHLRALHSEGYKCLLRSQSVADYMSPITFRPTVTLSSEPSNIWIALNIINEWLSLEIAGRLGPYKAKCIRCMLLYQTATTTSNSLQKFLLRNWLSGTLTSICMSESENISVLGRCNRSNYISLTGRLTAIPKFSVDSVCHILYQAMLCYTAGKYDQVLRLVKFFKEKVSKSNFYNTTISEAQYRREGGENLPIETMLKKIFLNTIYIEYDKCIPELHIELYGSTAEFDFKPFIIPPFLCGFFLQYLCQRRLGCQREADEALYEMYLLVRHDNGKFIGDLCRGISWQIVGICQEMNGDNWAAGQSFLVALQQVDMFKKTVASCIRLGTILVKYF